VKIAVINNFDKLIKDELQFSIFCFRISTYQLTLDYFKTEVMPERVIFLLKDDRTYSLYANLKDDFGNVESFIKRGHEVMSYRYEKVDGRPNNLMYERMFTRKDLKEVGSWN